MPLLPEAEARTARGIGGPASAAAAGAAVLVVAAHRSTPWLAAALVPVVVVSVYLAAVDIREHRLPNRIVAGLALLVTFGVLVAGWLADDPGRAGRAVALGVGASAIFLLGHLAGGVGMGDVKYAYPAAATVGWFGVDVVLLSAIAMLLAGGVAAGAMVVRGDGLDRRLPFGPCMVTGLVVGLVAAGSIAS